MLAQRLGVVLAVDMQQPRRHGVGYVKPAVRAASLAGFCRNSTVCSMVVRSDSGCMYSDRGLLLEIFKDLMSVESCFE